MKTKIILFLSLLYSFAAYTQSPPSGYKYVYQEEFNSKGSWPTGSNSTRTLEVKSGKYYFHHKKKEGNWRVSTRTINLDLSKDFELTTSIQKISGEQDYGTCFLYDFKDDTNYREFAFTSTGYYRVAQSKSGTYKNIKAWTKSSSVKKGNYAVNNLKVRKTGSKVYFYMNGTFLYSMNYERFMGEKMAIRLYRNQKVAISYIRASQKSSSTYNNNTNKISHVSKETIMFDGYTDNKNNWSTVQNENVEFDIRNGNYYFNHLRERGGWSSTITKYINTSRNFKIQADIKKESGILNNGYGIIFGRKDSNNQNMFYVSGKGSYSIKNYRNGNEKFLRNWTKSNAIRKGNGAHNVLKVVKVGSKLEYYINNTKVYTDYSPSFPGNRVGYIVYNRQEISVAYISVGYLDKKNTTNNNNYNNNNSNVSQTIINEDFTSNKNGWATGSNDERSLDVRNGKYYFEYTGNKGYTTTKSYYINKKRDFKIESKIQKINGTQKNGYGIIFGRKDKENQLQFIITSGGKFAIDKYDNNNFSSIIDWTYSSAIKQGNYSYNTLKIEKKGTSYGFYINGTKVYTAYNLNLYGNRYGFSIFDPQKIAIDSFSIAYIDDKSKDYDVDNISNYTYSNSGYHFSDQYTSNYNSWATIDNSDSKLSVSNGKYYIHNKITKGRSTDLPKYIDTSKDFEIETKLDKISGVTNYAYGLVFGKGSSGEFRFYISSGGWYKVLRHINGKEQIIQKWAKSTNIKQGNGKSNTLKVKKDKGYYKFYINNKFLFETEFENFYGDRIGYYVSNKQKVGVDYLRVKYNSTNNNNNTYTNRTLSLPLVDDFYSNKNGWYTGNFENYSTTVSNGRMTIDRKKKGGIFVSRDVDIDTSKDFVIETSITTPKAGASGLYGITFGRKNSSNEYSFLLSTNGSYLYRKFDNDKYTKIIPFTSNSAIRTSTGSTNKIKISKHGNLLRFYINGQYMNEANFEPFFGKKFGYTVYYEQKIVVDRLSIKYESNTSYNDPPVVVITEPTVELKRGFKIVEAKRIMVRGKATDSDGIFEITVNGVEANVTENGNFTANVPLKYGKNELVVKATDIKEASSTKTFVIRRKSPEVEEVVVNNTNNIKKQEKIDIGFGKYHALIIGVSQYDDDTVVDLSGEPTKDAQALADVLSSQYGFAKENVTILKNPTRSEITRSFFELRKKVTSNDNLLIFYAGHGNYDEASERGYWMPANVNMAYEENIILNTEIVSYIKAIKSKHTLLIADACFSGSIFKSRSYTKEEKSAKRKYSLTSRKAITSGTLKTVPNKSVFIKYLLSRLKQNPDKYLSTSKLFSRIEEPVLNNSDNIPQRGVIHGTGDEGGDFIFIKQ
ncbi:MAG: hypothetical protein CMB99_13915 [Flavobacteriaceae bacterium]|nr:hypothetical protein [Flavobacteriaceae bacterium]|tara:strand:- start:67023 stop:71063 length:4041 start_codon:yes stop_codon:yes gene_type:complete